MSSKLHIFIDLSFLYNYLSGRGVGLGIFLCTFYADRAGHERDSHVVLGQSKSFKATLHYSLAPYVSGQLYMYFYSPAFLTNGLIINP